MVTNSPEVVVTLSSLLLVIKRYNNLTWSVASQLDPKEVLVKFEVNVKLKMKSGI